MGLLERFKNSWNAFKNKNPTISNETQPYYGSYYRPDRPKFYRRSERSIINSIYTRIALDVSSISIRHCKLDSNDRFLEYINSGLDNCLKVEANIDQTGRAFIQDIVMSMLDEGCVAIVPIDTDENPYSTEKYDILTMRTGRIIEWYPDKVKVNVYDERTGTKKDIFVSKRRAAIVENPFYSVMNEPNSTLSRLLRKLAILDAIDEQAGSGKLDLIIQLPYSTRTELRKNQAKEHKKEIEDQLYESKYGIAYIDNTEKITQLSRPLENNLMTQIEYLMKTLYGQLGINEEILNGTADEKTSLNYDNKTIEPILSAICDSMYRTFLSEKARKKKQAIMFFRDPFRLVPVSSMAEIADKFTRNEIMTSNEIRQVIGLKPANDPNADKLINSNLNHPEEELEGKEPVSKDAVSNNTDQPSDDNKPKSEENREDDSDEDLINKLLKMQEEE